MNTRRRTKALAASEVLETSELLSNTKGSSYLYGTLLAIEENVMCSAATYYLGKWSPRQQHLGLLRSFRILQGCLIHPGSKAPLNPKTPKPPTQHPKPSPGCSGISEKDMRVQKGLQTL